VERRGSLNVTLHTTFLGRVWIKEWRGVGESRKNITDRQTDRKRDRETDGQTDRQIDRQTDRQTDR